MPISLLRSTPETLSSAPELVARVEGVEDAASLLADIITLYPLPKAVDQPGSPKAKTAPTEADFSREPAILSKSSSTLSEQPTPATPLVQEGTWSADQMADQARQEILRHAA